jgi:hypothetical protein
MFCTARLQLIVACVAAARADEARASKADINGWYPCSPFTNTAVPEQPAATGLTLESAGLENGLADLLPVLAVRPPDLFPPAHSPFGQSREQASSSDQNSHRRRLNAQAYNALSAECATIHVPLCHSGEGSTCTDPLKRTIGIFVKRLRAPRPPSMFADAQPDDAHSAARKSLFLYQGGPGEPSTALESALLTLHSQLNNDFSEGGGVDVLLVDHRGTGRSTVLDCAAAQVRVAGSINGSSVGRREYQDCGDAFNNDRKRAPTATGDATIHILVSPRLRMNCRH